MTVLILLSATLKAQNPDSASIHFNKLQTGFGLGYQSRQLIDEQKSALVYGSTEYQGKLFFTKEKDRSLLSGSLDFGMGSFNARHKQGRYLYAVDYDIDGNATLDSIPVTSGIVAGRIKMSYLRSISSGTILWMAGGTLQDQLVYPENNIGLLNSLSLNAALYASKNINANHTVSAKLEVPVFALNSRLPWHNTASDPVKPELVTFFKKGSRIVSVDKYQSFQLNLNYSCRVSAHWNVGAEYEFSWMRIPYYKPMKSFVNRLSVFTSYNF